MSLDHLPENRDTEQLYARLIILKQALNQATYDLKDILDQDDDNAKIINKELDPLRALHDTSSTNLLRWRENPASQTWGILFRLSEEYLQSKELIDDIKPPIAPSHQIHPFIDLIRNPDTEEAEAFKATQVVLKDTINPKDPSLPFNTILMPIWKMAGIIIEETYQQVQSHGASIGLYTENTDMWNLYNNINEAIATGNPQCLLAWYNAPNSPTWGHIFLRIGAYLKKIGVISEVRPVIPAITRNNERTMLHYWIRHPEVHPQIIDAMWRTKILAIRKLDAANNHS